MTGDICTEFTRDGYVIVKDVIGPQTVLALRSFFLPMFQQGEAHVLHDAILHYPQIFDVVSTPKLVRVLTSLLGETFVVPPYSSVEFNRFGLFHTDTTGAEISNQTFHKETDFRIVTVAIYLQDNNEYGGGIRLAPGSHRDLDPYVELTKRKTELRRRVSQSPLRRMLKRLSLGRVYDWNKPFQEHERGIDLPTKAGDAIIWDLRIAHSASPKRAKGPAPDGGKLSIFFNCGANNSITTQAYMKYVVSIPENEFLRRERPLPAQTGAYAKQEFVLL